MLRCGASSHWASAGSTIMAGGTSQEPNLRYGYVVTALQAAWSAIRHTPGAARAP